MRVKMQSLPAFLLVALSGLPAVSRAGVAAAAPPSAEQRVALVERTEQLTAEILPRVAAFNGFVEHRPVRIEAWTKAELRECAPASLRELHSSDGLRRAGRVMAALGLIPAGYDFETGYPALLVELLGGGYDPRRKVFYVLVDAPASQQAGAVERMVAAHELTHTLQDQKSGIFAQQQHGIGDWDYEYIYNAVIEGTAHVTMMALLQGVPLNEAPDATDSPRATRGRLEASPDYPMLGAPPLFVGEPIFSPAMHGTSFCRARLR